MGLSAIVVGKYLWWRYTTTMPTSDTGLGQIIFSWTLLTVETLVWIDTFIFAMTLSRTRNNSQEANAGEQHLRSLPPLDLPQVDVFIATYNEDLEVLEKTIVGATSLEWPSQRLTVYVLDDGKRDWLRDYCSERNIGYMTRDTNEHAKAGNINAAIARTSGEFFMVLDADFVPQENFLYRSMGFFRDEKTGIVQIPHNFYNADPMQTNLNLRDSLPDDQRLFFGTIMACRDAWNTAFCCGSNSITRRSAIEECGGGLPAGSITEDMLLTLALLRKGFVTRYLNERLAVGLAPESLSAMYVQRARWARGAIQILFLRLGPLGPGLKPHQRILFLPLHWLVQPLMIITTLLTPAICLWTGWTPLTNASAEEIISIQLPAVFATLATFRLLAPGGFFPLATAVHATLQAPRILPAVVATLIKPHGHAFKVTPKGSAAEGDAIDKFMIIAPIALILITALGLYMNANLNTRILLERGQIPLIALWAIISMTVLSIVQAVAVSRKTTGHEETFVTNYDITVTNQTGETFPARLEKLSISRALITLTDKKSSFRDMRWIRVDLPGAGPTAAVITDFKGRSANVQLHYHTPQQREKMIRKLFSTGMDNSTAVKRPSVIALAMIGRIFFSGKKWEAPVDVPALPPSWLKNQISDLSGS